MKELLITSSVLILVLTGLRFLFRGKISRRLQYALWGLVLLRLLLPISLPQASFSVMSGAEALGHRIELQSSVPVQQAPSVDPAGTLPPSVFDDSMTGTSSLSPAPIALEATQGGGPHLSLSQVLRIVWLLGSAAVLAWFTAANLRFSCRLRKARIPFPVEGAPLPVYVTSAAVSPCLFGLFHPAVYLTPKAAGHPECLRHVVTHELCHYRHGDHIWSLLRGLCLSIYWFNPLVWLAASLSRTDAELACDEAAIRVLGDENRLCYGKTLVDMIAVRHTPSGILCAATTMTSGKRGIKERLNMIIKNPKALLSAVVAVILLAALLVGCTFTSAGSRGNGETSDPGNFLTPSEVQDPASETNFSGDGDVYRQHFRIDDSVQGVVLYVEAWKNGDPAGIYGVTIADLKPGEGNLDIWRNVTGADNWETAEFQFAPGDGSVSAYSIDLPRDLDINAMGTSWLGSSSSETEFAITPDTPIILLYSPFQVEGRRGLSVYDCTYLMEDPARLSEYEYALVVKAVFTSGDPRAYLPEPEALAQYQVTLIRDGVETPVSGYAASLPQDIIMDAMVKSAAWPGNDVDALNYAFRIRQTLPANSETHDYYAYRLDDGTAVLQGGGYYTILDPTLMEQLDLAAGLTPGGIYSLDRAVSAAILSEHANDFLENGQFAAESHVTLGTVTNSDDTETAYVMGLYLVFSCRDGALVQDGVGGQFPMAFTFSQDENGAYQLEEAWQPQGGANYGPSIREKFPAELADQAMDPQANTFAQTQACYAKAVAYFGMDPAPVIQAAFARIEANAADPSDPDTYAVEDHRLLLYYGDYTLEYIFREFLAGEQTGAHSKAMGAVMRELLGGENIGVAASDAQDYFNQWKNHVLRLYSQNPLSYFQEYAPKSYLLLKCMGLTAGSTVNAEIDQLLSAICASPAASSNTDDYISAHPREYQGLIDRGDATLQYVISQFLQGGQTDLRGAVMERLLHAVYPGDIEPLDSIYVSPQASFDEWKNYVVRMVEGNGLSWYEGNRTATLLLNALGMNNTETAAAYDLGKLAVTGLKASDTVGVGVILDYADDDFIVFHGYFGLFAYNLNSEKLVMSVDLKKAIGTTVIQGSIGAAVRVTADGSIIQLYYYDNERRGDPEGVYYIDTADWSCTYGAYRNLGSYYNVEDLPTDAIQGQSSIGDLTYHNAGQTWKLFDF